jgi:hypothetical protein
MPGIANPHNNPPLAHGTLLRIPGRRAKPVNLEQF